MQERDETQMSDEEVFAQIQRLRLLLTQRSNEREIQGSRGPVRTEMPSGSDQTPWWISGFRPYNEFQQSTLLQDQAWVDDVFQYRPPTGDQPQQYDRIRTAARVFANVILETAPPCADRTAALRKLREVVMTINASIALNGRV